MPILKPTDYPNIIDHLPFSVDKITTDVQGYDLEFPKDKDHDVEWKIDFPIFVDAFYKFVYTYRRVPAQDEYFDYYLQVNSGYFETKIWEGRKVLDTARLMICLRARVYRMYPSLVRDLHFVYYAHENMIDCNILYNRKLDTQYGIDVLIERNKELFACCLYTDTARANMTRNGKKQRSVSFDNVTYVEMPLDMHTADRCGKFYLYGDEQIEYVRYIMEKTESLFV